MEVSKFPRKTWGAAHAQTVCTRHSLRFFERLGTRLMSYLPSKWQLTKSQNMPIFVTTQNHALLSMSQYVIMFVVMHWYYCRSGKFRC